MKQRDHINNDPCEIRETLGYVCRGAFFAYSTQCLLYILPQSWLDFFLLADFSVSKNGCRWRWLESSAPIPSCHVRDLHWWSRCAGPLKFACERRTRRERERPYVEHQWPGNVQISNPLRLGSDLLVQQPWLVSLLDRCMTWLAAQLNELVVLQVSW